MNIVSHIGNEFLLTGTIPLWTMNRSEVIDFVSCREGQCIGVSAEFVDYFLPLYFEFSGVAFGCSISCDGASGTIMCESNEYVDSSGIQSAPMDIICVRVDTQRKRNTVSPVFGSLT